MDSRRAQQHIDALWGDSIVPELVEYIRIPNKSPAFDPDWAAHGHMDEVVSRFRRWAESCGVRGLQLEVLRLPGRTPLMFMEVPGSAPGTVLLYGHLDKQPEMRGWREGLGPWEPVIEQEKLYGRGGADDGYAMFASLAALRALQEQGLPHARCLVLIEASEESGSPDLPAYIEALAPRIGSPDLVICLDSGCGNYEQLWVTTSLRGLVGGLLEAGVLSEGVHSGDAGGIVPSPFNLLGQLLARIEDPATGRVLPEAFNPPIPAERVQQAHRAAEVLGDRVHDKFPFLPGVQPLGETAAERILQRTWRPALTVTGASGLPPREQAGNVLLPACGLKLSLRLPPGCDGEAASAALKSLLESRPPRGARVRFAPDWAASGWNAPPLAPWLEASLEKASRDFFGRSAMYMGEGASIPFMAMLGALFPDAQFVVTGVLGPLSNAHGPNEFLHLPAARRLTACVSRVLADHALSRPMKGEAA